LPCRFLDRDAFVFGFLVPVVAMLVAVIVFLARGAVVARFTVSMQATRRARDKMRRRRHLQIFLFIKITVLIAAVAGLGALAKLTGRE
jgi:carbon starvation protein CstA